MDFLYITFRVSEYHIKEILINVFIPEKCQCESIVY